MATSQMFEAFHALSLQANEQQADKCRGEREVEEQQKALLLESEELQKEREWKQRKQKLFLKLFKTDAYLLYITTELYLLCGNLGELRSDLNRQDVKKDVK